MRTRSGAAKSHRPRHRLPPGLESPEAGCCWELGVEEVCEEREVRLASRAGLLHRHRPLRAGAHAWRDAWAYMYLDGHVRALSSSPTGARACGNDDRADVDASCGPRADGRDTYSWSPRTAFTHAESMSQRRGTFLANSATTRFCGPRHHAGGCSPPSSALWRREAGCSRRQRAQLATCLGRGFIPRRWEDDRNEEARMRSRHAAGGMPRARRIYKKEGGPRKKSRRRFREGRRKRRAGSRWRGGHFLLHSLCDRVHVFDAEPEHQEQSWRCGCGLLLKLCVNAHFDSSSGGSKGTNADGRSWRSGTYFGDRLCASVNPTKSIGGKGVMRCGFCAVCKVSPDNARRPRGGWRDWRKGVREMDGSQRQGTSPPHSLTAVSHEHAAKRDATHRRNTCHGSLCTSRYTHVHNCGGPIRTWAALVIDEWINGADGDGGSFTTQHHSPTTSTRAPWRRVVRTGAQRGDATANRREGRPAEPARREEERMTGVHDDADEYGSGSEGRSGGVHYDAVEGAEHASLGHETVGESTLARRPREDDGEGNIGIDRGSKGVDCTRARLPVKTAVGVQEPRRYRPGRHGGRRRALRLACRRCDGGLHAQRARRYL